MSHTVRGCASRSGACGPPSDRSRVSTRPRWASCSRLARRIRWWCSRLRSTDPRGRSWRCSRAASPGPPPRSRTPSARASGRCSAPFATSTSPGQCVRWVAGALGAGSRRRLPDSRQPCCSPGRCRCVIPDAAMKTTTNPKTAKRAEIVREYGPFPGIEQVHGVTWDGRNIWFARGEKLAAIDPASGVLVRQLDVAADAGTAFDGRHLWQIAEDRARKIHQVDANTGAILRTIESDRFVTGVSWVDGELWHATMEGEQSEIRRIDPENGEVLERLEMPAGVTVSGLEADGKDLFFCGGATSGKVRAVRKP